MQYRRSRVVPYEGGFEPQYAQDMELFQLEKPLYEEEYKASPMTDYDVAALATELALFRKREEGLSNLRHALAGH